MLCLHWLYANLTPQFSGSDVMTIEFDGRMHGQDLHVRSTIMMGTPTIFLGVPKFWAGTGPSI